MEVMAWLDVRYLIKFILSNYFFLYLVFLIGEACIR